MDNHEKMRHLHRDLTEMVATFAKYNSLSNLFSILHDADKPWGTGMLFGMVQAKMDMAESALRSACFHLDYHLKDAKKRVSTETVEGDGA